MGYPSEYRYTKEHEWIAATGQRATIGITDHAQQQLGDVVYVELPQPGTAVKANESFGTIESVKAVSEVFSPVNGTVKEVNGELGGSPELVNQDPHHKAWLIQVEMSQPEQLSQLMTAAEYEAFISEEKSA